MVMERSPSAFESMGEEDLRTHFLVQLNGHYEGQATGETFNYEGKTDILIRTEGRNIFIAECKYWGGPKKAYRKPSTSFLAIRAGAIPRRPSSSSTGRKTSPVFWMSSLKPWPPMRTSSGRSIQSQTVSSGTSFAHRDDPNRELTLTVLVFDVPAKEGTTQIGV